MENPQNEEWASFNVETFGDAKKYPTTSTTKIGTKTDVYVKKEAASNALRFLSFCIENRRKLSEDNGMFTNNFQS